ncbi:MAG: hypothetical protein B7Z58_07710 [Acidiphilium sp. 37-64-53]|uniref:glycosyltransferase family 61 protein n=1 Tax=Acidiphilium TaxID=522 RepID=UPI000BCA5B39|nr:MULTISPECIES: glycosyltransferase family 61 protein [Acidiphilium]OYW02473.1 MAG: hypothetical protein B7Z58_07710 [Acidiphilium sp. 37-64-53]OZB30259.1 MAG: hypothetical protein B7X49_03835 [Acidiphilium sp. 34-64-41]HQT84429.1 glycosyltransferase family 61 protein [Acidiphilium rubrum]
MTQVVREPFSQNVAKPDAAVRIARLMNIENFEPYFGDVRSMLRQASSVLGRWQNNDISFVNSNNLANTFVSVLKSGFESYLGEPVYLNGRPMSFPAFHGAWRNGSPDLQVIQVEGGSIALAPDSPIVFDCEHNVIEDFSTKYARLISYYDFSLDEKLRTATKLEGTVLSIIDDVFGLNYCHWISDWITRLAPFTSMLSRPDFKVLVSPIITEWQIRSLEIVGVSRNRIVALEPWQAVSADNLFVLSDISNIMHPAQKGADWAMDFFAKNIVERVLNASKTPTNAKRKLYISRSDASGRRIANEEELLGRLMPLGYEAIALSNYTFDEQVKLFSNSSHVVGIHGAGLTNVVFCQPNSSIIEILPCLSG